MYYYVLYPSLRRNLEEKKDLLQATMLNEAINDAEEDTEGSVLASREEDVPPLVSVPGPVEGVPKKHSPGWKRRKGRGNIKVEKPRGHHRKMRSNRNLFKQLLLLSKQKKSLARNTRLEQGRNRKITSMEYEPTNTRAP